MGQYDLFNNKEIPEVKIKLNFKQIFLIILIILICTIAGTILGDHLKDVLPLIFNYKL